MKKYKGIVSASAAVLGLLAAAWFLSGPVSGTLGSDTGGAFAGETAPQIAASETANAGTAETASGFTINPETGQDKYLTDAIPEGKPVPVEPQDVSLGNAELTCILSINCASILDNINRLDKEKVELVPENGVILPPTEVTFIEGESVFDVLKNETRRQKIHLEFVSTPIYNSAYIEGINNFYEFDCGELSGWMYKVNGWYPNYGCSRYQLKDGDVVEWIFTCDLGRDIGGFNAAGSY
ncbi:MAG: DUF4430 domain-containing protein [Clostridiales bacterium]|jgi:hypothetical protein|nr:DUF4430 domain-containing protein [Clostridiales bacterium]